MGLPNNPISWANRLTTILDGFNSTHGLDRFPINVANVSREFSKQFFPNEPITLVEGQDFSDQFEGMLLPNPNKNGEWGIIYNSSLKSKGRINFTIAHELGHYFLHRKIYPNGKQCSSKDMLDWESEEFKIESEANTFASYLLMPLDDFRTQIKSKEISLQIMQNLSDRYQVSVTAAILKWLRMTDQRAMIVVGKDRFIDWAWSSKPLLNSGIYYKAKQKTHELPKNSLASKRDKDFDNFAGIIHPPEVWLGNEEVKEMCIISDEYNNMSISLLIYPNRYSEGYNQDRFDELEDSYDRLTRFQSRDCL